MFPAWIGSSPSDVTAERENQKFHQTDVRELKADRLYHNDITIGCDSTVYIEVKL